MLRKALYLVESSTVSIILLDMKKRCQLSDLPQFFGHKPNEL